MDRKRFDLTNYRTQDELPISLRRSPASRRVRKQGEFLKGPIPLSWLSVAACLPGKALHVALAIWFEHGRRKCETFRLTAAIRARFGVERKASYAALELLKQEGLITVRRQHGKNPLITLINNANSDSIGASSPDEPQTQERMES